MAKKYIFLNSVETELLLWGNPFNCNGKDVIICITGNPGFPDFYKEFATHLHEISGMPVCVIGHAGHANVPDKNSNILKNRSHLFNLNGQLTHKLDLIRNHIDKRSKLHLVGHSIGAWLIIELLGKKKDLVNRVTTINLLFPTIQKMAKTKNGKIINNFVRYVHFFILCCFILLNLLPQNIVGFLVSLYLRFNSLPLCYKDRILKYITPDVGEKVLFMAYDEMDTVTKLNNKAINKIKHLTNVIYTTSDAWAPVEYMNDLKVFQPYMQMKVVNVDHAFVLKSSEKVADMVLEFINS